MSEPEVTQQRMLPTENEVEEEANQPAPWPASILRVAKCEKPKFYRMALMFFFIAYIYSVLRDTKDAVVMERQVPASIAFLKTFLVTPCSIVAVIIIQKFLGVTSVSKILKIATLIFGGYFLVYALVLLPFQEKIEFDIYWTMDVFGEGKYSMRGLQVVMALMLAVNFWTSSLLYLSAELWGNLVLSLLFMSYSNDICPFKQSLRFVPLFYIFSNFGLFLSGCTMLLFSYINDSAPYKVNKWVINIIFLIGGAVCMLIFLIQRNLENSVLIKPIYIIESTQTKKKSKKKVSFGEGFKYMMKSRLLLQLCFIVLSYNICTNLVDTTYKAALKKAAETDNKAVGGHVMRQQAYNQMGIATLVIGLLTTPFSRCVQIFGWTIVGFITPIWAAITTLFVFGITAFNTATEGKNALGFLNDWFKGYSSNVWIEEKAGMISTIGMKCAKYAFFDIAKEAISMRIPQTDRATFKGIYDGICGKLGKSGGSVITMVLCGISNATDLRAAAQYCFFIVLIFSIFWINAVKYLGGKYNASIQNNVDIDLDMSGKKGME